MAFNILKSFLPATHPDATNVTMTNPDIEMNNLETRSRTASASESIPRTASPHSDMELYTEGNAATLGAQNPAVPIPLHPSGEQLHPPGSPSISQSQNPVTSGEVSQTGGLPISQTQNPTNSGEALQARQRFAQFGQTQFGARPTSSINQHAPLLPAAEIIPSTHGKKRHRPEDEPAKVRIVRQLSFGVEESIAELEEKQKAMEERQKVVEKTLKEADQWAKEESNKRKLAVST